MGGQPATEPFPFAGTLLLDRGDEQGPGFRCGLSLIAKVDGQSVFAGVAHCVTKVGLPDLFDPKRLRVTLGDNRRSQHSVYPVSRVEILDYWSWTKVHPGPNGEQGDAALIFVPVVVPDRPVPIAPSKIGSDLRGLGWGQTASPPHKELPDQLQQFDMHRIEPKPCTAAKPGIATGEICTDNPRGAGHCFGDSGSAVVTKIGGVWFLVGSASRGVRDDEGVCGGDNPGVHTSWFYFLVWAARTIFGPDWKGRVAQHQLPAGANQILPPGASDEDRQRLQIASALAG